MVIVLGIIALILGAAITFSVGIQRNAEYVKTGAVMNETAAKLEAYRGMAGHYPTEEQGLQALVKRPTSEPTPKRWMMQSKSVPRDAWGQELVYLRPASDAVSNFELQSAGPDNELGNDDDVSSLDGD